MTFTLHPQLAADCGLIGQTQLCDLLLFNHRHIPWFILVPQRANVSEIYQLSTMDQQQLARESSLLGQQIMEFFNGDKLNIGALGNLVPQLHLHHIVRFKNDAAWPQPVWGNIEPAPFQPDELTAQCRRYQTSLAELLE